MDSSWREITHELAIPANTRAVEFVLTGTRNAGTDNDSYFDDLFMDLIIGNMACDEAPVGPPDPDAGVVVDAGPPTDGGLNPSDALTATDGGFVSDARTPGPDTASGRPESDTGRAMTDGGNDKRDGQAGATQTGSESAESGCSCRIGVRTGDSVYIFGIILFFGFSRRRRRYIV